MIQQDKIKLPKQTEFGLKWPLTKDCREPDHTSTETQPHQKLGGTSTNV